MMKDHSIANDKQFFEAYVFTYDRFPSPTVGPTSLTIELLPEN